MEDKNQTKHAVIDIGSNTIRTVIYALDREHNTARELISERDFTGIIAYVKYGQLCEAGRLRLVEVLRRMKEFCDIANCKNISCFSTASLRDADDIEEIRERVKNETGIDIRPLSAEEEALYDLEGLRYANVSPTGTGLDLGGGSCQIFRYNENGFAASKSMKIGCLTMSDAFVHGIFPTKHEAKKIRDKVRRALGDIAGEMCVPEGTFIYATGGTARAAARLHAALEGETSLAKETHAKLSRAALADIVALSQDDPRECLRTLARIAPARIHTLITGIIVLRTLCKTLGADGIKVVNAGIREGFLRKEILGAGVSDAAENFAQASVPEIATASV